MMNNSQTNHPLRILQWNCNSFTKRRGHLQQISENYDVIILLETKLNENSYAALSNFTILRNDRVDNQGGGIIIANKNIIPFSIVDSIYNVPLILETLAISIIINKIEFFIIAVYRPPEDNFPNHLWQLLINSIPNLHTTFIGGDFNCHNTLWGGSHTDTIGEQLQSTFLDNNLLLLNDQSVTFINKSNPNNPSSLDLSFISSQFYPLCSWSVGEDNFLSDHYPILIEIGIPK